MGGSNAEENVFKVININDNKHLVQKGLMKVTTMELIYTDSKTKEDWHWPLKFLRKYGCDGDVFTFEAGRKCPGGEGLYAFSTKKASILFEMVARNINQGNLQPSGEMSPFAETQEATSGMLNFPTRKQTPVPSPGGDQPSYTNLDMMGKPLETDSTIPDSPDTATNAEPKKFLYREVIFDKPPEDHPRPSEVKQTISSSSYSKIDFDQTAEYNRAKKLSGVLPPGPTTSTPHGRTSSTSTATNGSLSPTKRTRRTRVHTYTSGTRRDRHVSRSESSFSSQSSLTESSRDVRSPPKLNGGPGRGTKADPGGLNYQNVTVATIQEQQYQNVNVGAGTINQMFDSVSPQPVQQPNYLNVSLPSLHTATGNERANGHASSVKVNGNPMATYADLELSDRKKKRSYSSSTALRGATQSSYLQLEFSRDATSSVPRPSQEEDKTGPVTKRSASVSAVPTSTLGPSNTTATSTASHETPALSPQQELPEEETSLSTEVRDETKVTYGVLNFTAMSALSELSSHREPAREQKPDKDKGSSHGKKKK